jgi:hypothetical protein
MSPTAGLDEVDLSVFSKLDGSWQHCLLGEFVYGRDAYCNNTGHRANLTQPSAEEWIHLASNGVWECLT